VWTDDISMHHVEPGGRKRLGRTRAYRAWARAQLTGLIWPGGCDLERALRRGNVDLLFERADHADAAGKR
jgi:hypothetical protein